ncbi:MAG: glycoside hydrolase family 3 protein [Chlamydiota bacterium]|nr:glycoside hydrolase family 3 protein [Chlamydiota bacterium]
MTIEEKVGQILMVHFHGEQANNDAKILISQAHVGGFIYFNWSNGLNTPQQVQNLSNELQEIANRNLNPIPLLIAVDQEGGVVARLKQGFTVFPGNSAIARTNIPSFAEKCAYATSIELKAVGINMILGPVVDVNVNPLNPIIGVRSFSNSPETVTIFAKEALKGYERARIISVLKHFPGHGDVTLDSHADLPIVDKSLKKLNETELYPFASLSKYANAIMTAHLLVPALDPFRCATLSKYIIENILRKNFNYNGVVITDSLVMKGFLTNCPNIEEAAIRAFEAGSDLLILGGKQLLDEDRFELTTKDTLRIYHHLLEAVYSGRISEQRLNASVNRILSMKQKYNLFNYSPSKSQDIESNINTDSHKKLAREIANLSLNNDANNCTHPQKFNEMRVAVFAPKLTEYEINHTNISRIGKETKTMFFEQLNPTEIECAIAHKLVNWAETIIVCTYNAWKNDRQVQFIKSLKTLNKPITIIALRDPQDGKVLQNDVNFVISTLSPDSYSIQSAIDILTGVTNAF